MLTLVTTVWYVCGGVFILYLIVCAVIITSYEKRVNRSLTALLETCYELADLLGKNLELPKDNMMAVSDIMQSLCADGGVTVKDFAFYRQKEIIEGFANQYNESVCEYNELINNFPSCVVARLIGKTNASEFAWR